MWNEIKDKRIDGMKIQLLDTPGSQTFQDGGIISNMIRMQIFSHPKFAWGFIAYLWQRQSKAQHKDNFVRLSVTLCFCWHHMRSVEHCLTFIVILSLSSKGINRIYIYCPEVTEKSTNPSVKLTLSLPRHG